MTRRFAIVAFGLLCATSSDAQTAIQSQPTPVSAPPAPQLPRPRRDPAFDYSVVRFYPRSALRCGESGTVGVKVSVSDTGLILNASLLRSSGYADLDEAGLTAVRSWHFLPAIMDGKTVPSATAFMLRFAIAGASRPADGCPPRNVSADEAVTTGPNPVR